MLAIVIFRLAYAICYLITVTITSLARFVISCRRQRMFARRCRAMIRVREAMSNEG